MSSSSAPQDAAGRIAPELHAFIAVLRGRQQSGPGTAHPGNGDQVVRQVSPGDDLRARFCRAAMRAGCAVHEVTADGAPGCVRDLHFKLNAKSAWVDPQVEYLVPSDVKRVSSSVDALFDADVSITGVSLAIAETGSLVRESGPLAPRGATLVPPAHIAIIRRDQIVPDLVDVFAALAERQSPPASVVIITGPSKTADVEGVLVTGVHGPGELHIVVISS